MSKNILSISNLTVCAGAQVILKDVNLVVPKGEVHAIFGKNGSGKTSLMMTIMGFSNYQITRGEILYNGKDIHELDITERARAGIAICQQRPPTIDGVSLGKIIEVSTAKRRHISAAKVQRLVDLTNMQSFMKRDINANLSGGEIKRSELLQLLALSPDFSMMDEPDSGIDIEALALIGKLIAQLYRQERSGLIITHSGSIMKYVDIDKAHLMDNGTIVGSAKPEELLQKITVSGYDSCKKMLN